MLQCIRYFFGLPPNTTVTIHAKCKVQKSGYECLAHYMTNHDGSVDLSQDKSIGGFYNGVEAMGFIWAMRPSLEKKVRSCFNVLKYWYTVFSFFCDVHYKSDLSQPTLAYPHLSIYCHMPNPVRIEIKQKGLRGTLFIPSGKGPFPGVITMVGGVAGTLEFKAALFASNGIAAFALAFFGIEGLQENLFALDMAYFERAVNFMLSHEDVNAPNGIGVVGSCKGAQIAYSMADCLSGIRCVVSSNGAPFALHNDHYHREKVWPCVSFKPYIFNDASLYSSAGGYIMRSLPDLPKDDNDPELGRSLFNFHKRLHVSYLVLTSLDDNNIPSEYFANLVERLLKFAGHPSYKIMRYPGAGHLLDPPYSAFCRVANFALINTITDFGGSTLQHSRAQEHSWNKILSFLHFHLNSASICLSNM
uniref:BAAT/Acyl-CoA thioester hydrolase C-terminal domain-containing protein n=1 Tax=Ciona savignyi TaxID=51511 RepID=H2ZLA9_CIOSA